MDYFDRLHASAQTLNQLVYASVEEAKNANQLRLSKSPAAGDGETLRGYIDTIEAKASAIEDQQAETRFYAHALKERVGLVPSLKTMMDAIDGARDVPDYLRHIACVIRDQVGSKRLRAVDENTLRVLLADDDPVNCRVMKHQLQNLGYRVDTAQDGRQALHAMAEGGYAVVFMDLDMPGMDGLEATSCIRRFDDDRAAVPVIGVTNQVDRFTRKRCIDAGMDDFLPKPATSRSLSEALERWQSGRD